MLREKGLKDKRIKCCHHKILNQNQRRTEGKRKEKQQQQKTDEQKRVTNIVNINSKYIKITLNMKMVATPIKRKRTFIFLKNQDETIHCL